MIGNWFARVFAVSADNPQEGVRSLPSNVIQFSVFYNNPIGPPPELLSPVDNPTLTLPVPLSWAHVPESAAQRIRPRGRHGTRGSPNIEWFFNQYTEPTQVMLSLTSGPKFWRVLSQHGLSSPTTNANHRLVGHRDASRSARRRQRRCRSRSRATRSRSSTAARNEEWRCS